MCELCRKEPCDSRCPNAPEPKPALYCVCCREGILPGEQYWNSEEHGPVCKNCLEEMSADEVMSFMGESWSVAEKIE